MNKIEVSGRTTEEAVQIAAQELGVGTDAIDYEIVEEGAKGFLGLGQSPTTIKAWVAEGRVAAPPPVREVVPAAEEEPVEQKIEEKAAVEAVEPVKPVQPAETEKAEFAGQEEEFTCVLLGMLKDILGAMDVDATPVVRQGDEGEVTVEIKGGDVAILIGRHGETLDALQYLVSIAANRACGTRHRVILDAEGYRQRYEEILIKKAQEYATAVKTEGQECELEPQSARDRRMVHVTLADDPDVYTYSEGEGENRHVVISPKK